MTTLDNIFKSRDVTLDMKEKIINLLGVRSIITLALTGTLIFGFVVGKVEAKDFLLYVSMVLTFFFSKTEKEQIKNEEGKG